MKDKWMNSGYEGDDLKPHVEPVEDYSDANRIGERLLQSKFASLERKEWLFLEKCLSSLTDFLLAAEIMVGMGFTTDEIKDSLLNQKYNEVTATYLLLGLKTEVTHTSFFQLEKCYSTP